jgi:hypothetical protein
MSTPSNRPTFTAYSVPGSRECIDDEPCVWTPIGKAIPHPDGKGFNFDLVAYPAPDCVLVVRMNMPTPR